jgi:hypothetical protein
MTARRAFHMTCSPLTVCVLVLSGCGAVAGEASRRCHYDARPPLPDDIRQPERVILTRARRILRESAKRDLRSGLPQVLEGSRYRIEDIGTWTLSDKRGPGGRDRIIGATIDIALERPHPVNAIVVAAGTGWPQRSPRFRYSRHFGYVVHRARLTARSLGGLSVLVDVRRGRIAEVGPGTDPSVTGFVPLPGHCPLRPPPRGYD